MSNGYRKHLDGIGYKQFLAREDRLDAALKSAELTWEQFCSHNAVDTLDRLIQDKVDAQRSDVVGTNRAIVTNLEKNISAMQKSIINEMQKEMGVGKQEATLQVSALTDVLERFNWAEVGGDSRGR
jgi:hypothetical protein